MCICRRQSVHTLSADGYRYDPLSGLLGEPSTGNNGASLSPAHRSPWQQHAIVAVLTFTKCSFSSKAKSWDSRQSQDHGETVDGSVSGPPPHHGSRCRSSLKVAFRPRRNKTSAVPYRGAAHVPTNARASAHQHHPRLLVRHKLWVQEW